VDLSLQAAQAQGANFSLDSLIHFDFFARAHADRIPNGRILTVKQHNPQKSSYENA
jgi:hypothetical protein